MGKPLPSGSSSKVGLLTFLNARRNILRRILFRLGIFTAGLFCFFFNDHLASGALPLWLNKIPFWGHNGFVCPLCGGIRSFVWCCGLDFYMALHANILGIIVYFWLLLTLPVYIYLFFHNSTGLQEFMCRLEKQKSTILIILMAVCFMVHLLLHHYFHFEWLPLTQLNSSFPVN